ncbi:MAG: carboxypeptidase-like regulatory domain-containing protein, partial [Muribaculaceae bacterium]|nr:carboxypeptidase-like regulatory domain-containing protein [Muribaculaceae bacterium]
MATILDENNEPVIGASVMQKGVKTNAVTTNVDGNFTIRVTPGTPLRVSYVGYKPEEIPAAAGMTVYLQPTTEQLEQLVVVGYGVQKKANLT